MNSEIITKQCDECGSKIKIPLNAEKLKRCNVNVECAKTNCNGLSKVAYDEEGKLSLVRWDKMPDGSFEATTLLIEKNN